MSDIQPSVPLIVYLFAPRLLPARPRIPHGTHIPCTHEQVQTQPLAVLLFATAFWSLRRQGVIAFDVPNASGNGWLNHHADIAIKRLGTSAPPGLEGVILDHLDDGSTLCDVVCRWSAMGSTDPWHDAVNEAVSEAVAGGYLSVVPNNGGVIARHLWRGSEYESNCELISSLEPRWKEFDHRWRHFEQVESSLCGHLAEECKRSLLACTEVWYP